ncbi:MAG: ABC transporter permease [Lachnospiraceae bacterium]|nr:ABC transporter permease [Lachnospiraceae bacterium]
MTVKLFFDFLYRAIIQGIPLLYGCSGEILTERSGHLNLGIPGIMYVGAMSGVIGAYFYEHGRTQINPTTALLLTLGCSILGSLLMGLIYCFLTITLRANQNVTGLALTTFGVGFGNFFGGSLIRLAKTEGASVQVSETSKVFKKTLSLEGTPAWFRDYVGRILFTYSFFAYLAIAIALILAYVLRKTRVGLHLRAVGENPATADAAGINVNRYKYVATSIGSVIAGLGGLYYIMDYADGVWSNNGFGDRGWLAIALVIFSVWRPAIAIAGSFFFGGLYIIHNYLPGMTMGSQELIKMTPYVVTVLILILISTFRKKETQPPAHLGLSYFREER